MAETALTITPGAQPLQALNLVDRMCAELATKEASLQRWRTAVGRGMVEIKTRKLYLESYATFEEFTQEMMRKHKLSRTTLRNCMTFVTHLPMLEPDAAVDIPMRNLYVAAQVVRGGHVEKRAIPKLLREAKDTGVVEFSQTMEERGWLAKRGRPTEPSKTVTLKIEVSRSFAERWYEYVGSKDPGRSLAALLPAAEKALAA